MADGRDSGVFRARATSAIAPCFVSAASASSVTDGRYSGVFRVRATSASVTPNRSHASVIRQLEVLQGGGEVADRDARDVRELRGSQCVG